MLHSELRAGRPPRVCWRAAGHPSLKIYLAVQRRGLLERAVSLCAWELVGFSCRISAGGQRAMGRQHTLALLMHVPGKLLLKSRGRRGG